MLGRSRGATLPSTEQIPNDESANTLVKYLLEKGLGGFPPLSSATDLADGYLIDQGFATNDARVHALWQVGDGEELHHGFHRGSRRLRQRCPWRCRRHWLRFLVDPGPHGRRHRPDFSNDLAEERVRTLILLSLAGDVAKEAMSDLGLNLGSRLPQSAMKQVPGRALVEINKRIGMRLLAKAGQRGLAQFPKVIPVVGGVVGGAFDAVVCRMVGRTAKKLFRPVAGS